VCPECGEPAGSQPFCANCGRNLTREERLPSREEWDARRTGESSANGSEFPSVERSKGRVWLIGIAVLFVAAAIAAVVLLLGSGGPTTTVRMVAGSMEPTIKIGQSVGVIESAAYVPKVGDIVLLHPPAGADPQSATCGNPNQGAGHQQPCGVPTPQESTQQFIKRIVAGPGDTVAIISGHVVRNGSRVNEPFIEPCGGDPSCSFPTPITIPAGHYFVLGDNRGASDDSRFWAPVPRAYIVGQVQP
jgi:signal peptidase I